MAAQYVRKHWKGSYEGMTRRERKGGFYEAYQPDFLQGRTFLLQGETAADIFDAERAIYEINEQAQSLRNTEALARLILRAEALSSSRIEGLVIGPKRVLKAELDESVQDVTAQEVLNNISAMDKALQYASEEPLSVEMLMTVHEELLSQTEYSQYAGHIRSEQNWLGGNSYNPCGASFVPPPHELVPELLNDLIEFCNADTLSPLAQAAVAHAQFETIHPFVDGNGRVGRALIHIILKRRGMCPSVVPPISLALATRSKNYITELSSFRHTESPESEEAVEGLNSWLSFFAGCTLSACKNALVFEDKIDQVKQGWLASVGEKRSASIDALVDAMVGNPIFTAKRMMEVLRKSAPTVNAAIEKLEEAGAVKQINVGKRNRAFEAVGIVEAFTNFERNLASPTDDTTVSRPARPAPFKFEE